MSSTYPRGSEWRKWDLHLHTPSSPDYKDKSATNLQIIEALEEHEISAAVISDHNYIDVDRIKDLQQEGKKRSITIFPGIELRGEYGKEPINYIGIFPEDSDIEYVRNELYSKLELTKKRKEGCKEDELYSPVENGCKVIHALGGIVSIHAGKKSNSIECIPNTLPSAMAQKKDIASCVDIFELGSGTDADDYTNIVFNKLEKIYPMVVASDNHDYKSYGFKHNNYCWIKADPTFEGLKQIVYEPVERVIISETNPGLQFDKPFFNAFSIVDDIEVFEESEDQATFINSLIPLNKNMVTIIGGRGSGKSLLIDYLGSSVFNNPNKRGSDSALTSSSNFIASYSKNNINEPEKIEFKASDDNYLDFLFIPQGTLKSITKSSHLNEEIKSLLELDDLKFSDELTQNIDKVLSDIDDADIWFNSEDETGERVNDKKDVTLKKSKFEKLLESITTQENQQKLEKYSKNIEEIEDLEQDREKLDAVKDYLTGVSAELNVLLEDLEKYKIPKLNSQVQDSSIKIAITEIVKMVKKKNDENIKIKEEFKTIFTGDLSKLLKNAEQYKRAIKTAERKLEEISKNEKRKNELKLIRAGLGSKIKLELQRQRDLITSRWEKVFDQFEDETQKKIIRKILEDRKIEIKGEIVFDVNAFYEIVEQNTNMNYFKNTAGQSKTRRERMMDWLNINDLESYASFIETEFVKHTEDEEENKKWINGGLKNVLFDLKIRSKYLYTQASVKYQGKPINKLSAGQRGTTYLCIQLARNAFSTPIIFDQPEDDLDNEFIINDLVGIFKELKKYRQIIIVTHNANLVVNSDAEQVIVAHNNDENLTYISGSLENVIIIKSVCDILEGGSEAFDKRMKRYR